RSKRDWSSDVCSSDLTLSVSVPPTNCSAPKLKPYFLAFLLRNSLLDKAMKKSLVTLTIICSPFIVNIYINNNMKGREVVVFFEIYNFFILIIIDHVMKE